MASRFRPHRSAPSHRRPPQSLVARWRSFPGFVLGLILVSTIAGLGFAPASPAQNPVSAAVEALQPDTGEGTQEQERQDGGATDAQAAEETAAEETAAEETAAEEAGAEATAAEETGAEAKKDERPIRGQVFDPETWQQLWEESLRRLITLALNLPAALLILIVFFGLYRVSDGILRRVFQRANSDPALSSIVRKLSHYALLVLAVLMAASQLGLQVGSLLAGVGILGLAVGLAAQESLANLIAGLTLLWDRPFRIGDRVTIAEQYGSVEEIGLRSTRILTLEQRDVILPNREVINRKIINHTRNPNLRLPVLLSIAYKEDTRRAREVLLEAVQGHGLIRSDPEPEVVVLQLADSGVQLELRVWLKDPHQERQATFVFTELAKVALDEAGIEIPFPQVTLHWGSGVFPMTLESGDPRRPAEAGDDAA